MKAQLKWQVTLALVMLGLTALVYYAHFVIFRDPHHIFLYFVGDVAFVFFEVLLVTLIIDRLLHHREHKALRDKLNMLRGAFFSELGTDLLSNLASLDHEAGKIAHHLAAPSDWSEAAFLDIRKHVAEHRPGMASSGVEYAALDELLRDKKAFLLDLIQNPSLLEDESFTNLVWAVFHLAKEMEHRGDLKNLPREARDHLAEDTRRVYHLLLVQWTDYMNHLSQNYPHLFSLADRRNPFKRVASVEVK